MRFPTKSATLNTKPRTTEKTVWKWFTLVIFILSIYILIRNYIYINRGMLKPNFGLIHKAYDFNFLELPLTLLFIAMVLTVGAFLWQGVQKNLVCIAALFTFAAIDLFALRYYVTFVEPQRLVVRHIKLETEKLIQPVRLLHISDIQSGGISEYEQEIFERIRELKPDLIVNTGDFLQVVPPATFESEFPKLLGLIRAVSPQLGTYAVFGDTERELYKIHPEELLPMKMLSSQSKQIDTGSGKIDLYGLSLYQSKNQDWATRAVDDWLTQTDENAFCILFGHAPDFSLGMQNKPIDLCLAGHTHGGQVRLPWYGSLMISSKVPREWARGFRKIGIPYLNVSAGAGSNRYNGLPPIRLNCPTEMTLIELVPSIKD